MVRAVEPIWDRSIGTLILVPLYSLRFMLNWTSPWNAGTASFIAPLKITPVV